MSIKNNLLLSCFLFSSAVFGMNSGVDFDPMIIDDDGEAMEVDYEESASSTVWGVSIQAFNSNSIHSSLNMTSLQSSFSNNTIIQQDISVQSQIIANIFVHHYFVTQQSNL